MANTSAQGSSGPDTLTVIAEQPGGITLVEQDGVFTVTNGDGQIQYAGGEVGAEFSFWRTTFGVPVDEDSEVDGCA